MPTRTREYMTFNFPVQGAQPGMIDFVRRLEGFLQRLEGRIEALQNSVEALEARVYALEHP